MRRPPATLIFGFKPFSCAAVVNRSRSPMTRSMNYSTLNPITPSKQSNGVNDRRLAPTARGFTSARARATAVFFKNLDEAITEELVRRLLPELVHHPLLRKQL